MSGKLPDYQQRVIDEKAELDARIEKLLKFFDTDAFKELKPITKDLMRKQSLIMGEYSGVLGQRIEEF